MKAPSRWRRCLAAAIGWTALYSGAHAEFLFSEIVYYEVGEGSGPFAKGDFDSDGDVDLAVGNTDFGTVTLYRNDGNGALGSPSHYPVGSSVVSIAAGDLDNDGDADVAFADEGLFLKSIGTLLNNGNGTFAAGMKTPLFDANIDSRLHPRGMVLGDFNGDGLLDAAVACEGSEISNRGFVVVAMNAGNGSFADVGRLSVGPIGLSSPKMLATGDFTGEGSTDLVVGNRTTGLALFENMGAAVINAASTVMAVPQAPTSLEVEDLDGDGDQDLILTTGVEGTAWIVITDSEGGPPRFQSLRTGATRPGTPALGDFDSDGDLDLAVTESIQLPNFGTPSIYLVENAGAGVFRPGLELAFGEFPELPEWIEVADLDGDGDSEILVTDRIRGRLGVYFNQTRPPRISSADQDGDGDLSLADLLVLGTSWYRATEP